MNKLSFYTNTLLITAGNNTRQAFLENLYNFHNRSFCIYQSIPEESSQESPLFKNKYSHQNKYSPAKNPVKQSLIKGSFTVLDLPEISGEILKYLTDLCKDYYYNPFFLYFSQPSHNGCLSKLEEQLKQTGFQKGQYHCHTSSTAPEIEISPIPQICSVPPPYDIIGDVHGCCAELRLLFEKLGYLEDNGIFQHPQNRTPIFIGDIGDRGPCSIDTINLALNMAKKNKALYVIGNHCIKLARYFEGRDIKQIHGVETTIKELKSLNKIKLETLKKEYLELIESLPYYLILDEGKLAAAHAGIKEEMIGRDHSAIRHFCFFGAKTGRTLDNGLPERLDWAADYRGKPLIVYGHTPVNAPVFINNTINIDQGCVFGGSLTALRYPEMTTLSVPAFKTYYCRNKGYTNSAGV